MLTTDSLAHVIIRLGLVYRRSHHEGEVGRLARSSPSSSWQAREAAIAHKTVRTGGLDSAGKATSRSLLPFFRLHRRMPNWTRWLRWAAATPNPAASRSAWMRLDARMGRRAHALARHPNRSRRGGRSPQTPWRGAVPRTEGGERAEPEVGEGRQRRRERGPHRPELEARHRWGAGGGAAHRRASPRATLLHSASAPSIDRRSSGRGRAAPQIDTRRRSGHGHGRPRTACSAGTSMGHVAGRRW
jgi:hypothetical protein